MKDFTDIDPDLTRDFTSKKQASREQLRDALDTIHGRALVYVREGPAADAEDALLDLVGPVALPRIQDGTAELRVSSELPPGVLIRITPAKPLPVRAYSPADGSTTETATNPVSADLATPSSATKRPIDRVAERFGPAKLMPPTTPTSVVRPPVRRVTDRPPRRTR